MFADGIGVWQAGRQLSHPSRPSIDPVQHAPKSVPMELRSKLTTLNEMVEQDVLAPVTTSTPWISAMVVVPKKNGKLRICLDPKHLHAAVQREHYPLPTIEDIATRLHGAKVYTILTRHPQWVLVHLLRDESCQLTIFNTPFGREVRSGCCLESVVHVQRK